MSASQPGPAYLEVRFFNNEAFRPWRTDDVNSRPHLQHSGMYECVQKKPHLVVIFVSQ